MVVSIKHYIIMCCPVFGLGVVDFRPILPFSTFG